jgi:hypothetical protein
MSVALLIDRGSRAGTRIEVPSHAAPIVDTQWYEDAVVTRDERGAALIWRAGRSEPEALRSVDQALSPIWRLRAGLDTANGSPVVDAALHGPGILVARTEGEIRYLGQAGQAGDARVPSKFHRLKPGALASLWSETTAVSSFSETVLVEGVPPRPTHRLHAEKAIAGCRGDFVVSLATGAVGLCSAAWPSFPSTTKQLDALDVGLTDDDALVVLTKEDVRVIDAGTWEVLATSVLSKPPIRIAVRSVPDATLVAVAFKDGTLERLVLPAFPAATRPRDRFAADDRIPLAPRVVEELKRLLVRHGETPASIATPIGPLPLRASLRELFAYRSTLSPHGNSPGVWSDLPAVEFFYERVWEKAKTPAKERRIDLGAIHFSGTPELVGRGGREPWSEPIRDGDLYLILATVEGSAIRWRVHPNQTGDDPIVTFEDTKTGVSEVIGFCSEILYRLAPGAPR